MSVTKLDIEKYGVLIRGIARTRDSSARRAFLVESGGNGELRDDDALNIVRSTIGDWHPTEFGLPLRRLSIYPQGRHRPNAKVVIADYSPLTGATTATNATGLKLATVNPNFQVIETYAKQGAGPEEPEGETEAFEVYNPTTRTNEHTSRRMTIVTFDIQVFTTLQTTPYTSGVEAMLGKVNVNAFSLGGRLWPAYSLLFNCAATVNIFPDYTEYQTTYRFLARESRWLDSSLKKKDDNTIVATGSLTHDTVNYTVPLMGT